MGMPFYHCAPTTWLWVCLLAAGVIFWYWLIALEWARGIKGQQASTQECSVLTSLISLFLLCSFCGYGFRILSVWYPNYWILVTLLAILNAVSASTWIGLRRIGACRIIHTLNVGQKVLERSQQISHAIVSADKAAKNVELNSDEAKDVIQDLAGELRRLTHVIKGSEEHGS